MNFLAPIIWECWSITFLDKQIECGKRNKPERLKIKDHLSRPDNMGVLGHLLRGRLHLLLEGHRRKVDRFRGKVLEFTNFAECCSSLQWKISKWKWVSQRIYEEYFRIYSDNILLSNFRSSYLGAGSRIVMSLRGSVGGVSATSHCYCFIDVQRSKIKDQFFE